MPVVDDGVPGPLLVHRFCCDYQVRDALVGAQKDGFDGVVLQVQSKAGKIDEPTLYSELDCSYEDHSSIAWRISQPIAGCQSEQQQAAIQRVVELAQYMNVNRLFLEIEGSSIELQRAFKRIAFKVSAGLQFVLLFDCKDSAESIFFNYHKLQRMLPSHVELGIRVGEDIDMNFEKWLGHGIKHVFISEQAFGTSTKGFPVLLKGHDEFVAKLMRLHPVFYLQGESSKSAKAFLAHLYKSRPRPGTE